jgi:hypothetical protein
MFVDIVHLTELLSNPVISTQCVMQKSTLNSTKFYHFAVNDCDCVYYYALHALKCFGFDTTV